MPEYSIWRSYWFYCGVSVPLMLKILGLL